MFGLGPWHFVETSTQFTLCKLSFLRTIFLAFSLSWCLSDMKPQNWTQIALNKIEGDGLNKIP
jgi:hypothetical protein